MRTKLSDFSAAALVVWAAVPLSAGEGVAALHTADPACPDGSGNIYVDCGNGTVTDNRTSLVWLKNADCVGAADWITAREFVAGLSDKPVTSAAAAHDCGLSDDSSPGEWRLPSAEEWEAMTADAVALGCIDGSFGGPSITADDGATCWQEGPGSSFTGVLSSIYWSASRRASTAWGIGLYDGEIKNIRLSTSAGLTTYYVWPVRDGR